MGTLDMRSDVRAKLRRTQGNELRARRKLAGITIGELADRLSVTPGAVSQWETGRFTPRAHHQVAIAEALGAKWSDLFGLDGSGGPNCHDRLEPHDGGAG